MFFPAAKRWGGSYYKGSLRGISTCYRPINRKTGFQEPPRKMFILKVFLKEAKMANCHHLERVCIPEKKKLF
jgi:hypothetical protein